MDDSVAMRASDRGILIGANGTGKSTLAAHVLESFRDEYPDARIAVLDTKPRWRAAKLADGTSPKRLYRPLAKGDTIPGSMSLSRAQDWPLVWDKDLNPSQTVIVQRLHGTMADNVRFQVGFAEKFFATQRASRPSLLYLDEGMDFFSTLIGVQRPVGINLQCLTETNWCALFRINYANDVKRLYDMGWPHNVGPPEYEQQHCFRLWRARDPRVAPLYKLGKDKAA